MKNFAENLVINVTKISNGAGVSATKYAQILYKGIEVGFINEESIFLKMYHPQIVSGVYKELKVFKKKTFSEKCRFLKKHWNAIYDGYDLIVRGK